KELAELRVLAAVPRAQRAVLRHGARGPLGVSRLAGVAAGGGGDRGRLVTRGLYRWTRNPQNAMLMVVYAALAVTADGGPTYLLCAAMIAVYFLMVLLEEPWLSGIYGEA